MVEADGTNGAAQPDSKGHTGRREIRCRNRTRCLQMLRTDWKPVEMSRKRQFQAVTVFIAGRQGEEGGRGVGRRREGGRGCS